MTQPKLSLPVTNEETHALQLTELTKNENVQNGFSLNCISLDSPAPGVCREKVKTASERSYIVTLLGVFYVQFSAFVSMSILFSFFLSVCQNRKVSGLQGGAILGVLQSVFIFAPYTFLTVVHKFPLKLQMVAALIVAGITLTIFAFLDEIESDLWFIVSCLVVRAVQGISMAVLDVSSVIVVNKASPPEILSTVIGFYEMSISLGQAIAPPLGGYLFQIGGFMTPFLVSAAMMVLAAVVCLATIPKQVQVEKKFVSEMIRVTFQIKLYCAVFLICGGFIGFFSGMIEPQLRQFALSPVLVGVVILVTNVFAGATFPVWGHICDFVLKRSTVTYISCTIGGLGFILFGPFPYIPIPRKLWIVVVSLALSGTAISGTMLSNYGQIRARLGVLCRSEEIADTVASAAFCSFATFGFFFGDILGGIFIDHIGYRNGAALLLGIQILVAFIQIIIVWKRKHDAIEVET